MEKGREERDDRRKGARGANAVEQQEKPTPVSKSL